MSNFEPKTERPRWKFVAFVFVYMIAIKLLPYVMSRFTEMSIEEAFASYPWGFSPIFALALFGGAIYRSKMVAVWAPLAAMLLGDLGIWAITGVFSYAFYSTQVLVYLSFALCAVIGFSLRSKRTIGKTVGAGFAGCLVFFIITNFGAWIGFTTYPKTLSGLIECYIAGLPFFRNHLIATAIFGGILFSPACLYQVSSAKAEPELLPATSV